MDYDVLPLRVRAEFLEMPGLRLTLEQAQRFFGLDRIRCQVVLEALVAERFLLVKPNGLYGRASEGDGNQRRTANNRPPVTPAS